VAVELLAVRDVGILLVLALLYAGVLAALKATRRHPER
jgi:ABC-type Mn2+/Zn2+ transport system permease subunit